MKAAAPEPAVLCEHHECRCARAEELMEMADFYGSARLAHEAVLVHETRVRCRLVDRPPRASSPRG